MVYIPNGLFLANTYRIILNNNVIIWIILAFFITNTVSNTPNNISDHSQSSSSTYRSSSRRSLINWDPGWVQSTPLTMPKEVAQSAVAYSQQDNMIYLFGGEPSSMMNLRYDIPVGKVTDNGFVPLDMWQFGQYWTQQGNLLYVIRAVDLTRISVYDLETTAINEQLGNVDLQFDVAMFGCLTSDKNRLYIVGGPGPDNVFQFMDLATETFYLGNGMMLPRSEAACIIVNSVLWVIGGTDRGAMYYQEIDRLTVPTDTFDLMNQNWEDDINWCTLDIGVANIAAVAYGNDIVIVGGRSSPDTVHNEIQIINTITGGLSTFGSKLLEPLYSVAPIIVGNVLYAFGGKRDASSLGVKYWQTLTVDTLEPTMDPTA
eukprot:459860_1